MSVDIELRKAAAFINSGRFDAAKSKLSNYLREFPESDTAWLLMSYALDDLRLRQAAATRALRLNPANEQAKARIDQLLQLQGPPAPEIENEISVNALDNLSEPDPGLQYRESTSRQLENLGQQTYRRSKRGVPQKSHEPEYPLSSFIEGFGLETRGSNEPENFRRLRLKSILTGVGLMGLLVAAGVVLTIFPRIFMSEADAIETAIASTGTALATESMGMKLPPSWTSTITPTITATPTSTRTPTITNTPTPVNTRTPRATRTTIVLDPTVVAEMEVLSEEVAELRKLSTAATVNTSLMAKSDLRSVLETYYFYGGGSEEEISNNSKVLVALGLIEPDYDLLTYQLNTLHDNIGGFHHHVTNQIYILGDQFTAVEKYAYVYEYNHVLANLHFNFNDLSVYPSCEGNEDRCLAIRALIEGDASLLALQWLEQKASPTDYEEINNYQPTTWILPDQNPPQYSLLSIEFPYMQGKVFVGSLFSIGGWSSVSNAYFQLPQSTEQILHPEKYLLDEQPITVPSVGLEQVLGDDWSLIKNNTLGEWVTYLILRHGTDRTAQVDETTALQASAGWGGDDYQFFYNDQTGETLLIAHWKWDSPKDADEFATGMRDYLEARFPSGEAIDTKRECWYEDSLYACLYIGNRQNLWILAPSIDLVDRIQSFYPEF
jgi:hypothetical protein